MRLTVLFPLHIGDGSEITSVDIYPGDGMIFVLDTRKLTEDLLNLGIPLKEILTLLKDPPGNSYVFKGYIDSLNLNVKDYTLYTLPLIGEAGRESMRIKNFIKSNGKPYIPGSSIKGAIRTAVFYRVLKECGDTATVMDVLSSVARSANNEQRKNIEKLKNSVGWNTHLVEYYLNYINSRLEEEKRFDTKSADDLLEAIVFGMEPGVRYEPKRDPMRALVVRDSEPIGKKHLAVYRVNIVGADVKIPTWVEALKPETTVEFELAVDGETLRLNGNHFNGLLWECLNNYGKPEEVFEDFIWKAVDEFYGEVIKAELDEIHKHGPYRTSVSSFYRTLPEGRKLRLGWGSGWISTTVGILLRKEKKWESTRRELGLGRKPGGRGVSRDFPKTRRVADGMPMGWVKVE
ncbi:CRISPR-associated protein, Csm5 family [Thermococcus sp. 2319x1]|uniref:type III-A CRISPR-associated RAMP protein Csm5 n=1 Tax=Thermococcus sp. 2319x1 TaxID=1674923 RepID=UPI00073AC39C|nr:type III-A CRISPR-associated RAMP protein Csm5 [Thermococcus sp. 2319x1]ALV63517.1 CRISPR-associated protein, Csm5 family [Thermococcus sp. 2319x1]